eukprot:jgi/Botrbrau1/2518/Bobra.0079s0010.1
MTHVQDECHMGRKSTARPARQCLEPARGAFWDHKERLLQAPVVSFGCGLELTKKDNFRHLLFSFVCGLELTKKDNFRRLFLLSAVGWTSGS